MRRDVVKTANLLSHVVLAFSRDKLDISCAECISHIVDANQPDMVINYAVCTAVDRAEKESELVFTVNRDGPAKLAAACAHAKIPLIHVLTDYVFNGDKKAPYVESDPVRSINFYRLSKASEEEEFRKKITDMLFFGTPGFSARIAPTLSKPC